MYLGIDVGFGWVKCAVRNEDGEVELFRFPSAVALVPGGAGGVQGFDCVEFEGSLCMVGDPAVRSEWVVAARDMDSLLTHGPVLVFKALKRTGVRSFNDHSIGVGLPPGDYSAYRERIAKGWSRVAINGDVMVNEVKVYPQGAAALVDYFEGAGSGAENLIVVDIGHNTLDVVPVWNGRAVPGESGTVDRGGLSRVADELVSILRSEHGVNLNVYEASILVERREMKVYGRTVDLGDRVDRCLSRYSEWLFSRLSDRWGTALRKADVVLMIGGGARLLGDYIPDRYRELIRIPSAPEYANARGFLSLVSS
jgi:plasmid segregation protein ParM